ncbi:MAG: GTP-binding protein, partial [Alphaproteobacteria bacterium]
KGHFWVASRPDWVIEFSLAGALSSIKPLGHWWAVVPESRWPQSGGGRSFLEENWVEPWGDRRQEIVFIGSDYNWSALKARLDDCLVPEASAQSIEGLPDYADPLPTWRVKGEE